ncbi:hypothetical protein RDWZM_007343 [Blomia tropicalis]|uniref:Transcriptional coactivator p15 (PC4) C-terminal domain-containing protein n=1 Tax=Blomia tropicalis TaxID=40697 RepID=A0A9Q0RJ10_BLOTA|nr:hypothetical protein RDWZM_007343 [Blomia tropicalis]
MSTKNKKEIDVDSGDDSEMKDSVKLSKNRYLTVSTFKNKVRVDIREYYVADNGKRRPGKKGISLSLDEWGKLKDNMDTIQTKIEEAQGDSD